MANQGFHHPTYNPNGSKLASDGKKWYETTIAFNSIADCFDNNKLLTASGYIGTTSARPDGIFYDQIHESSILDLRMSSQKVEDYNRLIDREFNKLVAGTYRGSEGEWACEIFYATSPFLIYDYDTTEIAVAIKNSGMTPNISVGDTVQVSYYNGSTITSDRGIVTLVALGYFRALCPNISAITSAGNNVGDGTKYVVYSYRTTKTKSNTLTHTDIIGSPANYPTAWKQSGVSGTPLIVAEDGTSLLPTGALTVFKLSRKANATPLQVLKSTDSGATWTALAVTTGYTFSTTTNAITMVIAPATTDLIMVTYQTHTNMAVPTVNSEVIALGEFVLSSDSKSHAALIQSLLSKVTVGATSNNSTIQEIGYV